jgi:pimeloyl-ACP methyl ester carboxylesterase
MQPVSHSFRHRLLVASFAVAVLTGQTESRIPIGKSSLYCREIGQGQPVSTIDDADRVRQHFHLESTALLGHSWGTVIALEYAIRYPNACHT